MGRSVNCPRAESESSQNQRNVRCWRLSRNATFCADFHEPAAGAVAVPLRDSARGAVAVPLRDPATEHAEEMKRRVARAARTGRRRANMGVTDYTLEGPRSTKR